MSERRNNEVLAFNKAIADGERLLNRGFLTLSEYHECMDAMKPLFHFETVETISKKVMDFFKSHGAYIEEAGIGWLISWN